MRPYRRLEPYILRPDAEQAVQDVGASLGRWYRGTQDPARYISGTRRVSFPRQAGELTNLHYHLSPDLDIVIRNGSEPVIASRLVKGPYDFYNESFHNVAPDEQTVFERIEHMQWRDRRVFYVGSTAVMFGLPSLAHLLATGGELSVVTADELTTV